jgi:thioester reductase-like protein
LITGASGAIGSEVADALVRSGNRVVALLHANQALVRNDGRRLAFHDGRLEGLQGDVTQPRLGLARREYERLRSSVDVIVHSAAVTAFDRPKEMYEQVNERGTRHVVDFAMSDRDAPIPLVHVSTAYVCGNRHGLIHEGDLDAGQQFANAYERSKFNTELLIRAAAVRGLPAAIVRPSIVVGSARTGVTRQFNNIYTLMKVVANGRLSIVPANYDAILNLVPIDYVADLTVDVADRIDEAAGRTFHAVGETPLTLRDCGDVFAEYPPFLVPRFIPPESFDPELLTKRERAYYKRIVEHFEPYLQRHAVFSVEEARSFSSARQASRGKALLRRLLEYSMKAGYLGRAPALSGSPQRVTRIPPSSPRSASAAAR